MATFPSELISEVSFISTLFLAIDSAEDAIQGQVTSLMTGLEPLFGSMLVIYIIMWGLGVLRGSISPRDSIPQVIKVAVVYALVLKWDHYQTFVSGWVWDTPDALARIITGIDSDTVILVQQLASFAFKFGQDFWKSAMEFELNGVPNLIFGGLGMGLWIAGGYLSLTVVGLLLISKFMLSILLSVGPLFIAMILFESTKRLFDAWLGQIVKYMLYILLLVLAVNLVFSLIMDALLIYAAEYVVIYLLNWLDIGSFLPSPLSAVGIVTMLWLGGQVVNKTADVADMVGRSVSLNLQTGVARK